MEGGKTLPTSAGAVGMGCIGFPVHPVWEVTSGCNLHCKQCHASGGKRNPNELSTEEGKALMDEMAKIPEFRMLVFSGGEPLVRSDIFELVSYARQLGFEVSIASNGTLLTYEWARRFKELGVANMAIGLNSNDKVVHEGITQVPGSFERSKQAIYATRELGMNLQINTTVMKEDLHSIPGILDFASEVNAQIVLLYQLVPEGRGKEQMELSVEECHSLIQIIAEKQKTNKAIIEPICSPQYWAYLIRRNGGGILGMKLAQAVFKGCVAGSGLCYIKPDGEVWACPFIPLSAGNVRQTPLSEIWDKSELFHTLRDRRNLKGKCGECCYNNICGGCRGRAYAHSGDFLAEDPLCFLGCWGE
jgi:radical SAM protein with 4Fe4S-binding SPASM domain